MVRFGLGWGDLFLTIENHARGDQQYQVAVAIALELSQCHTIFQTHRFAEFHLANRGLHLQIQVLQIGPAVVAGLPGEIFVELGLRLKAALPDRPVFVAGYANGNVGYVPTRAAYDEGGYEVTVAQRARLLPLSPDAGEQMVAAALDAATMRA